VKTPEKSLGMRAAFLLPSLKLKSKAQSGQTFEHEIHRFLISRFDGYTAAAGNLFGYWKDRAGSDSYGEHRQFTVALVDDSRLPELKNYLSQLARELGEECVYLETGDRVALVYGEPGNADR
jgi:hypothetical protein